MKAIIEIASNNDMHSRAMTAARAHAEGRAHATDFHLGFESAAQVFAELTVERLRTLEALREGGVQSVYALANALGRNYSNVHDDVQRLMALGLVERGEHGVSAPFDELEIHVPLKDGPRDAGVVRLQDSDGRPRAARGTSSALRL